MLAFVLQDDDIKDFAMIPHLLCLIEMSLILLKNA